MPHVIVVDACVARSASESQDPTASRCRQVLDGIDQHGHKLAMSKPLQDEWFKSASSHGEPYIQYASMYALHWFVKMRTVRRIEWVELDSVEDVSLRILAATSDARRPRVEKDLHLVETALASDRRIISHDGTAKEDFTDIGQTVNELCEILWLDPTNSPVWQWLQSGAPDRTEFRLCAMP
jgi:hypothetical protein